MNFEMGDAESHKDSKVKPAADRPPQIWQIQEAKQLLQNKKHFNGKE